MNRVFLTGFIVCDRPSTCNIDNEVAAWFAGCSGNSSS